MPDKKKKSRERAVEMMRERAANNGLKNQAQRDAWNSGFKGTQPTRPSQNNRNTQPSNSSTPSQNSPQTPQRSPQRQGSNGPTLTQVRERRNLVTTKRNEGRGTPSASDQTARRTGRYRTERRQQQSYVNTPQRRVTYDRNKTTVGQRISDTLKGSGKQFIGGKMASIGTAAQFAEPTARGIQNTDYREPVNRYSLRSREEAEQREADSLINIGVKEGRDLRTFKGRDYSGQNKSLQDFIKEADDMIASGSRDIERAKDGAGAIARVAIDMGANASQMVGDMLENSILPGLGIVSLMTRAAGTASYEARQEGMDVNQQMAYAAGTGLIEGLSEGIFNSVTAFHAAYGKGALSLADKINMRGAATNIVQNYLKSDLGRSLALQFSRLGAGMLEEGTEEIVAGLAEPALKYALTHSGDDFSLAGMGRAAISDPKDLAYSFLVGALMGGLGGVTTIAGDVRSDMALANQAAIDGENYVRNVQDLIARGKVQGREGARKTNSEVLAEQIQGQMDSGKTIQPSQVRMLQRALGESTTANERSFFRRRNEQYEQAVSEGRADTVQSMGTSEERTAFNQGLSETEKRNVEAAKEALGESGQETSTSAVALGKAMTGSANTYEVDTILADPKAREAAEDLLGEKLPVKNAEARTQLENRIAMNEMFNRDEILTEAQRNIRKNMSQRGGVVFDANYDSAVETIGVRNAAEIYESFFSRLYTDGTIEGSDFNDSYDRIIAPLKEDFGEELGGRIAQVFNREFAQKVFMAGQASLAGARAKSEGIRVARSASEKPADFTYETEARKKISDRQADLLKKFAERANVHIRLVNSIAGGSANGMYDPESGVIMIAADSTNKIITVAKHELTHHIKATSPELYQKLEDFVLKKWYDSDRDAMERRVFEYQKKYNGSVELAREELIADASEAFFTDKGAIDDVMSFSQKLGKAIHDGIKTLLDNFLDIQDTDNRKYRGYGDFLKDIDILKEAESMWLEALGESANRGKGAETPSADDYSDADAFDPTDYKFSLVEDENEIRRLNAEPSKKTYRAMALIDGKLYPPMATQVRGKDGKWTLQEGADVGQWLKSDITTDPKMFNSKGQFVLKKDNGDTIPAAYNPYIHSSDTMLNDQFSSAYKRPNIVVVEGEIPRSELLNGKRAEHDLDDGRHIKAKDPTGTIQWKAGVVQGKLTGTRTVFLTNHFKPTRVVPDSEVAKHIQGMVADTDVAIPYNVVTPNLRKELQKLGVKMEQSTNAKYKVDLNAKFSKKDEAYLDAVNRGDMETAQRMVDEEAKKHGYDSPKLYHGTRDFGFTQIKTHDLESKSDGGYYDWSPFFATDSLEVARTYSAQDEVKRVNEGAEPFDEDRFDDDYYDAVNDLVSKINSFAGYYNYMDYDKNIFTNAFRELQNSGRSANDIAEELIEDVDNIIMDIAWEKANEEAESDKNVDVDIRADELQEGMEAEDVYLKLDMVNSLLQEYDQAMYGETYSGNYELFANTDNILQVDAKGHRWNDIPFDAIPKKRGYYRTRDLAEIARDEGYDGIQISNVFDDGGKGKGKKQTTPASVYIFFKPERQIKSADPVVYDDKGEVIPLSQRFDPDNIDIRFSRKDSEGNELSKGQQEYFGNSQVKNEDGSLKVMYHGSPNKFTTFDIKKAKPGLYGRGFYFTEDKSRASQYGEPYKVYLDIETPLQTGTHEITKPQLRKFISVLARDEDYGIENYGYGATVDSVLKSVWGKDDYSMLQDLNASAVGDFAEAVQLFNKVNGTSYDGIIAPTETIAFYPEQIKETVNKNPTNDSDIRFSMKEPVEETKDLVAVHNLEATNLESALELGGFPMPSIAIIKASAGHNMYGDFSLIFDKNTIDPSVDKRNVVYGGDAWTPTFPHIAKKINGKAAEKIRDNLISILGIKSTNELPRGIRFPSLDVDNLADKLDSRTPYEAFKNDDVFRMAYLKDAKNLDLTIPTKEGAINDLDREALEYLDKRLPEFTYDDIYDTVAHTMEFEPLVRAARKDYYNRNGEVAFKSLQRYLEEEMGYNDVLQQLEATLKFRSNGIPQVADVNAFKESIAENVDENGYKEWINNLFEGIVEKKGIRNNKDFFTRSGNRRSWEALHDEPTLLNIARVMAEQENGETLFGSSLKANAQKKYRNISEVKADKGRLKTISEEEYKKLMDSFAERESEIITRIDEASPTYESNPFMRHDEIRSAIVDNVRKGLSKSAFLNDLKKWGNTKGATQKDVDDIFELVKDVANMPTGYFEAKPKRPVTFYEVRALLAPSDADANLITKLQGEGVNVVQYEAGNEEDRIAKLNQAAEETGTKFSLKDSDNDTSTTASQNTITKLEEKVKDLKAEFKRTNLKTADQKQTRIQAGRLIARHGSNMQVQTNLVNTFNDIFKLYKEKGTDAFDEVYEMAKDAAVDVVNNISLIHDEGAEEYKAIKQYLRETSIEISDDMKRNITDYNDFRKRYFGKLKLVNGETSNIDNVYMELMELFPEQFTDEYTNPADQLYHIVDVLDNFAPYYETLDGASPEMQDYVVEIASDIMETAYNLQTKKTFADKKYEEKVRAVKKAREKALASRNKALDRQKQRYERKIDDLKQKNKDYKAKVKENAEKKRRIMQIADIHKRLSDMLLKPSDNKHLPDGYAQTVSRVLGLFDFTTKGMEKWAERNGRLSNRYKAFKALKEQLEEMGRMEQENGKPSPVEFDDELIRGVRYLYDAFSNDLAEGTDRRLADMTSEELKHIKRLFEAFEYQVKMENKSFDENNKKATSEAAHTVFKELDEEKKNRWKLGLMGRMFTSNFNPSDFFELIGGEIGSLYNATRLAFDKYVDRLDSARTFIQDRVSNRTADKWANSVRTFTTSAGEEIKLTDTQLMSLYCLSKREQAQGHMYYGGIVSAPVQVKKKLTPAKLEKARVIPTQKDVASWLSQLTPEQIALADSIQEYFVDVVADWGNETSLRMFNYRKFNEKNYFPIQSSSDFMASNFDMRGNDPVLKNIGPSKATVTGANNAIVVDDIFTVFSKHVAQMASYNAYVPAITDFQKVWNYTEGNDNDMVKSRFARTYGDKTAEYVENFFKDLNGVYKKNFDAGVFDKGLGLFKKAAVGGNIRVLVQQPTAIARAALLVNPAYLTAAVPLATAQPKKTYRDMMEHCPIARWKTWGFYSSDITSASRDLKNIMIGKDALTDKIFMNMYGTADNVTWTVIFKACELQVEAQNKGLEKGSDEYWEKVNELASRVFDRTQVVDSPFHRSMIMKSQDKGIKMVTAFMAEPTKTINMLNTELTLAGRELKAGHPAKAAGIFTRVATVITANAALLAVAQAAVDALRHVGGDDDKDKGDYKERFVNYWRDDFADNLNPLGMIPYIKDVKSIWDGYDVARMDMNGVTKVVKATQYLIKYYQDPSGTKYTEAEEWRNFALTAFYAAGIPISNAKRDIEGAILSTAEALGYNELFFEQAKRKYQVNDKTKSMWADMYWEASNRNETKLAKDIHDYLIKNGLTEDYIEGRMKSKRKENKSEQEQNAFDNSIQKLEGSAVWRDASDDDKDYYSGILEKIAVGIEDKQTGYVTNKAKSGLTNEDVILYKLALKKVDKPNDNGNLGTYTKDEKSEALKYIGRTLTEEQKKILMG